jgi:hypothetical protein
VVLFDLFGVVLFDFFDGVGEVIFNIGGDKLGFGVLIFGEIFDFGYPFDFGICVWIFGLKISSVPEILGIGDLVDFGVCVRIFGLKINSDVF